MISCLIFKLPTGSLSMVNHWLTISNPIMPHFNYSPPPSLSPFLVKHFGSYVVPSLDILRALAKKPRKITLLTMSLYLFYRPGALTSLQPAMRPLASPGEPPWEPRRLPLSWRATQLLGPVSPRAGPHWWNPPRKQWQIAHAT